MKWFKHDSDANMDAKMQEVLLDYGLDGYGLYWYCIELIAAKVDKDCLTFELEHDARVIARNTGATVQKIEEMMRRFVEIGLFENSTGNITCMKLSKRLDKSMTSNPQMRNIIGSIKESHDEIRNSHDYLPKNHDSIRNHHDSVMTESGKVMQDKIRLDKIRLDKNRIDKSNTTTRKRFKPPTVDEVRFYCMERNNSVDPEKWMDHYISVGWKVGRNPMKDWKAAVRKWESNDYQNASPTNQQVAPTLKPFPFDE